LIESPNGFLLEEERKRRREEMKKRGYVSFGFNQLIKRKNYHKYWDLPRSIKWNQSQ
jgi:hypothetical protein